MKDRNSVLMQDNYLKGIVSRGLESGLINALEYPGEEDFSHIIKDDYSNFYKKNRYKTSALQMFLLYDKVLLVDTDMMYDYNNLIRTGFFEIITAEDDRTLYGEITWNNEIDKLLIQFKEVILKSIIKDEKKSRVSQRIKQSGLNLKTFYSEYFDIFINSLNANFKIPIESKVVKFLDEDFKSEYKKQQKFYLEELKIVDETFKKIIAETFKFPITSKMGGLLKILEISEKEEAVILQNSFDLGANMVNPHLNNQKHKGDEFLESYKIIRLNLESIIGSLPKLSTIEDVLRLKEKRNSDIKRLRNVINNIELQLREGKEKANKQAISEIKQAVKELNKNSTLDNVSRWATYLSVPIGTVEALMEIPPVAGFLTGVTGSLTSFKSKRIIEKNEWINVVR